MKKFLLSALSAMLLTITGWAIATNATADLTSLPKLSFFESAVQVQNVPERQGTIEFADIPGIELASPDNPVEITQYYLRNASFDEGTSGWDWEYAGPSFNEMGRNIAEVYSCPRFDIYQTVSLPAGSYELRANALYRAGHFVADGMVEDWEDGSVSKYAYIYANSNKCYVKSICEEGTDERSFDYFYNGYPDETYEKIVQISKDNGMDIHNNNSYYVKIYPDEMKLIEEKWLDYGYEMSELEDFKARTLLEYDPEQFSYPYPFDEEYEGKYYPFSLAGIQLRIKKYPGIYQNSVITYLPEDGELQIGIKKISSDNADWVVMDDFQLFYLGSGEVENPNEAPDGPTSPDFIKMLENCNNAIQNIEYHKSVFKKDFNITVVGEYIDDEMVDIQERVDQAETIEELTNAYNELYTLMQDVQSASSNYRSLQSLIKNCWDLYENIHPDLQNGFGNTIALIEQKMATNDYDTFVDLDALRLYGYLYQELSEYKRDIERRNKELNRPESTNVIADLEIVGEATITHVHEYRPDYSRFRLYYDFDEMLSLLGCATDEVEVKGRADAETLSSEHTAQYGGCWMTKDGFVVSEDDENRALYVAPSYHYEWYNTYFGFNPDAYTYVKEDVVYNIPIYFVYGKKAYVVTLSIDHNMNDYVDPNAPVLLDDMIEAGCMTWEIPDMNPRNDWERKNPTIDTDEILQALSQAAGRDVALTEVTFMGVKEGNALTSEGNYNNYDEGGYKIKGYCFNEEGQVLKDNSNWKMAITFRPRESQLNLSTYNSRLSGGEEYYANFYFVVAKKYYYRLQFYTNVCEPPYAVEDCDEFEDMDMTVYLDPQKTEWERLVTSADEVRDHIWAWDGFKLFGYDEDGELNDRNSVSETVDFGGSGYWMSEADAEGNAYTSTYSGNNSFAIWYYQNQFHWMAVPGLAKEGDVVKAKFVAADLWNGRRTTINVTVVFGEDPYNFAEEYKGHMIYYHVLTDETCEVSYRPENRGNGDNYIGDIVIPETVEHNGKVYTVTAIGEGAFQDGWQVTSVVLPKTITEIGANAFSECYNMKSINIPDGVTEISDWAFGYCESLTKITLPEGLTRIGYAAFGQSGLNEIVIPNTVVRIEDEAFIETRLTSITIPASVEYLGGTAIFHINNLNEISVEKGNPNYVAIDNVLFTKDLKKLITYPIQRKNAEYIVPEGVETIGHGSFYDNKHITAITLPETIENIDWYAFAYCNDLKTVTIFATTPPYTDRANFDGLNLEEMTLNVPAEAIDRYCNADVWCEFGNINGIAEATELALDDDKTFARKSTKTYETVTYTRNFTNTELQPLYVPFSMSYDDWSEDFDVYRINGFYEYDRDDDGQIEEQVLEVIKVKAQNGALKANHPYMIKAKEAGEKTITLTNATVYAAEANSIDCSTVDTKYTFTGTYSKMSGLQTAGFYCMSEGKLCSASSDEVELGAFRWYMSMESRGNQFLGLHPSQIRVRIAGEDANGIDTIQSDDADATVYTVDGRKVEGKPAQGLYIKNGKKYYVK